VDAVAVPVGVVGPVGRGEDVLVVDAQVGQVGCLNQPVGDVDAESVDAAVEPEAQDGFELGPDPGMVPVEVRLLGAE
jgi:hypothetical protein